jgi:hypothetical protein
MTYKTTQVHIGWIGPTILDMEGSLPGCQRLSSKRMPTLEENDHETMWIMVNNKVKQVLIAISYRQKVGNYAPSYWEKLQKGYDKAIGTKIPNILMVGDFNADPGGSKSDHLICA